MRGEEKGIFQLNYNLQLLNNHKILTNLSTCKEGGGGGISRLWDIVIMYFPRGFVEHVPD